MSIAEKYEEYKAWVALQPKRFIVDNSNIVCISEDVGAKIIELTASKTTPVASVRIEDNKADLEGFLAWGAQLCKC